MDYQAKLSAPFGVLGILCQGEVLTGIDFLPQGEMPQPAVSEFAEKVCVQLLRYFENASVQFSIPLEYKASAHQKKVWQTMMAIPCGQTRTYGDLARQLGSSAQAVGQACGANPIPIIIPCHRVVGKGGVGGFMKSNDDFTLNIKRWLLNHEARFEQR